MSKKRFHQHFQRVENLELLTENPIDDLVKKLYEMDNSSSESSSQNEPRIGPESPFVSSSSDSSTIASD